MDAAQYAKNGEGIMPYDQVMDKWKAGKLKSGGSGKPVKSQKQAVAIMLSEKRAAQGGKKEYQSEVHSYDHNRPKLPQKSMRSGYSK